MLSRDEEASRRIERLQYHQFGKRQYQNTQYYSRDNMGGPTAPIEHVAHDEGILVPLPSLAV